MSYDAARQYVDTMRRRGHDDEETRHILQEAGWNRTSIDYLLSRGRAKRSVWLQTVLAVLFVLAQVALLYVLVHPELVTPAAWNIDGKIRAPNFDWMWVVLVVLVGEGLMFILGILGIVRSQRDAPLRPPLRRTRVCLFMAGLTLIVYISIVLMLGLAAGGAAMGQHY